MRRIFPFNGSPLDVRWELSIFNDDAMMIHVSVYLIRRSHQYSIRFIWWCWVNRALLPVRCARFETCSTWSMSSSFCSFLKSWWLARNPLTISDLLLETLSCCQFCVQNHWFCAQSWLHPMCLTLLKSNGVSPTGVRVHRFSDVRAVPAFVLWLQLIIDDVFFFQTDHRHLSCLLGLHFQTLSETFPILPRMHVLVLLLLHSYTGLLWFCELIHKLFGVQFLFRSAVDRISPSPILKIPLVL